MGIIVNPFSGRDVRRVAARASTSDHHEKQQQVTRLVLGAFSQGVEKIYLAHEPFRINEKAVENLPERDQIEILRFTLTHSARDTTTMAQMMWDEGCRVFIVLGGDGTSRIVARSFPDVIMLPLSTGTNNVFPYRLEATVAGMAAGLVAAGKIPRDYCRRCKRIQIRKKNESDIALIDAVLLRNDFMGSLLPFKPEDLSTIVLTRAEPASIGISPIGGFLNRRVTTMKMVSSHNVTRTPPFEQTCRSHLGCMPRSALTQFDQLRLENQLISRDRGFWLLMGTEVSNWKTERSPSPRF